KPPRPRRAPAERRRVAPQPPASWNVSLTQVIRCNLTSDDRSTKSVLDVAALLRLRVPANQRDQNPGVADDHATLPRNLAELGVARVETPSHAHEPHHGPRDAGDRGFHIRAEAGA